MNDSLTLTETDLALAAELGLTVTRAAETDRDRQLAADPRATHKPVTYHLKNASGSAVGKLYGTPVGVLYASKYRAGVTLNWCGADRVESALRWVVEGRK